MNHPWGLSGPAFLWLYAVGFVLALGFAIHWRRRARAVELTEPARLADEHQLGYLAQGPRRAVEVALARLLAGGGAHISRSGAIVPTSAYVADAVDRAVRTRLSKKRPRGSGPATTGAVSLLAVTDLREQLVRQGLAVATAVERRTRRQATIAMWVLFAVGVVRFGNGAAQQLPVGYLAMFLALTIVTLIALHAKAVPFRTTAGDEVLTAAKNGTGHPALSRLDLSAVGALVALGGFLAYPDETIRTALLATAATGAAAAGSGSSAVGYSCSSSTSSCGSGSSCGGGGGCGGGGS